MDNLKVINGKNKKKQITLRDLREKFYLMDDAYINGHARVCGIYATGVYNVLCRHVGTEQSCFPSVRLIADKLGVSGRQVTRAVKVLEGYNIVAVERSAGEGSIYYLTDKSKWKKLPADYYQVCGGHKATKAERKGVKVTIST